MEPGQPTNTKNGSSTEQSNSQSPFRIKGNYELILNWYKINGKNLLGEETLTELQIQKLLKILGNPIWNQIYHCWAVELKHMPDIQPYSKHQFDPDKYTYFIEAYNNN